jgi:hypothetical protein
MTTIDRNPDIDLDIAEIPKEYYLHEGKRLQMSARAARIPFGVAFRKDSHNSQTTFGLVIRHEDKERLTYVIGLKEREAAKKAARKAEL